MDVTTTGRYRVLGRTQRDDAYQFVDLDDDYEPVTVEAAEAPELTPGWVVEATLAWEEGSARIVDCEVQHRTHYHFYDDVTGMFEAARQTWTTVRDSGDAMGSTVTRDTDGDPAGALYVFAEQRGARDIYDELRTGVMPIEPLVERVNDEAGDGERAVFVMRPADEEFVCVYVVFDRDGLLARTVCDTYGDGDDGSLPAFDGFDAAGGFDRV